MRQDLKLILSGIDYKQAKTVGSTVFVPITGSLPLTSPELEIANDTIEDIRVSELEQEDVNQVSIQSEYQGSVLIVAGMVLMGGRQTRTPTRPFIINKGSKATIPVNCIEQGRWSYTPEDAVDEDRSRFKFTQKMVSRKTKSTYASGGYSQGQTWGNISSYMAENELSDTIAPTQNYLAVEKAVREKQSDNLDRLRDEIREVFNNDTQRGILVFEKGELVSLEVYSNPQYWSKINDVVLESNLLDILSSEKEEENPISEIGFDEIETEKVKSLVDEESYHVKLTDMNGWAVGLEDKMIYLSLSRLEAKVSEVQELMQAQETITPEFTEGAYQQIIDEGER